MILRRRSVMLAAVGIGVLRPHTASAQCIRQMLDTTWRANAIAIVSGTVVRKDTLKIDGARALVRLSITVDTTWRLPADSVVPWVDRGVIGIRVWEEGTIDSCDPGMYANEGVLLYAFTSQADQRAWTSSPGLTMWDRQRAAQERARLGSGTPHPRS